MRVVLFHYHLNRGGVTQVIVNHLRALNRALTGTQRARVALVSSGRREGWPADLAGRLNQIDLVSCDVRGIDYGRAEPGDAEALAEQIRKTLIQHGFPPRTTVIHSHNHALGKNLAVPGILARLAGQGYPLLLQIHDFAEDFRPGVFRPMCDRLGGGDPARLARALYPQADSIHYAVLNSRDAAILHRAGFSPSRIHLLPNPVARLDRLPDHDAARIRLQTRFGVSADHLLFLYPVRGIARKNLGEMLLWSALAGGDAEFTTTVPPLNPAQQPLYNRWKGLAADLGLRCQFETGVAGGLSFAENLAAADRILTTSVAEGFGMVFLESWLAGRLLVGRDLPEITGDFVRAGLRLPTLRPQLLVPISWPGRESFVATFAQAYRRVLAAYGRAAPADDRLRAQVEALVVDGMVDFAFLDGALQAQVIRRAQARADSRRCLVEQNTWLEDILAGPPRRAPELIAHNARVVQEHYGLKACGRRLVDLYHGIVSGNCLGGLSGTAPCGTAILDAFLHVARFRPLQVGRQP